jgi:hypothetical protein
MCYFIGRSNFKFLLAEFRELTKVNRIRINGMQRTPFLGEQVVQEFFSLHGTKDE